MTPSRSITWTTYPAARSRATGTPHTHPWEDWCEILQHRPSAEKDGLALVLARMAPGLPRRAAHVEAVEGLAIDVDDADPTPAYAALDRLGVSYLSHTTYSHAPESPRWRVLLPLAEPIAPIEHARAWAALHALTGAIGDRSCKDPCRLYYWPSHPLGGSGERLVRPGRLLSLSDLVVPPSGAPTPSVDAPSDTSSLRRRLRTMPASETTDAGLDLKAASRALLAGDPIGGPGQRHALHLGLTLWIARHCGGLTGRPPSWDDVSELFRPSVSASLHLDSSAPGMDDVRAAWEGALVRVATMRDEIRADRERAAVEHQRQVAAAPSPVEPSDADVVAAVSARVGYDVSHRWILMRARDTYYVLDPAEGIYQGPYDRETARVRATETLAEMPVLLNEPQARGGFRRRGIDELVEVYGQAINSEIVDVSAQGNRYDPATRTIYTAPCPLVITEPHYDEQIARWLGLMAGPRSDKLLDWLACFPDLTQMLCALYISGEPRSGKTLLAKGLARLWSVEPANFGEVFGGNFSEDLLRCPYVHADEDLEGAKRGGPERAITGALRSFLTDKSRQVQRKFRQSATAIGCMRLVITSNTDYLLAQKRGTMTHADLQAIGERFLYLAPSTQSRDYLDGLPRETKEMWGESGIARHVLHLATTREVQRAARFAVAGDIEMMHERVAQRSGHTGAIVEWIVRWCMSAGKNEDHERLLVGDHKARGIFGEDGHVWVNTTAVTTGWSMYLPDMPVPTTSDVSDAIGALAIRAKAAPKRAKLRGGKGSATLTMRQIPVSALLAWSADTGVGSALEILRAADAPAEDIAAAEREEARHA